MEMAWLDERSNRWDVLEVRDVRSETQNADLRWNKTFQTWHMVWNKALQIKFRQWGHHYQNANFQENELNIGKPTLNLNVSTRMQSLAAFQQRTLLSTKGASKSKVGVGWKSSQRCLTITCFEPGWVFHLLAELSVNYGPADSWLKSEV